jgi:DNA-binding PadR family transcriptional regulator
MPTARSAAAPRSPLALVVLAMLAERPMHAYALWQLMRERQKTAIVNVSQRNSLYQVIDRLERDGLVTPQATERAVNRPERVVYAITAEGRTAAEGWVRELLAAPKAEYPSFPVALSLAMMLAPEGVASALEARLAALGRGRDGLVASLESARGMGLPELFVLDDDYRLAVLDAEIAWVGALRARVVAGELHWSAEWMAEIAARFTPGDANR